GRIHGRLLCEKSSGRRGLGEGEYGRCRLLGLHPEEARHGNGQGEKGAAVQECLSIGHGSLGVRGTLKGSRRTPALLLARGLQVPAKRGRGVRRTETDVSHPKVPPYIEWRRPRFRDRQLGK